MSSFKVKIGVISFVIVTAVTVAMMLLVVGPLSKQGKAQAISAVRRGAKLVQRSQTLYAYKIVAQAKKVAKRSDVRAGIKLEDEKKRRIAVYVAIDGVDKRLQGKGFKVGFLGVVDKDAKVIARDKNLEANAGDKLGYAAITAAIDSGRARSGVLSMNNTMMRVAVAPVVDAGTVIGAVVLAYPYTAHEAQLDQQQFGAHVAYILGHKMRATSFTEAGSSTEDAQKSAALSSAIMARAQDAMKAGKVSDVLEIDVAGETYKAITGPLPPPIEIVSEGVAGKSVPLKYEQGTGFVVVSSLAKALAPAGKARILVIVFGLVLLLVLTGCVWVVAQHFVNAQDHLELGINEVINGDLEYVFDAQQEFEGMANALNVMLARLLGRPEPGEDGEDSDAAWRADVISVEPMPADSDAGLAAQLAGEAEDQYFARLYSEYVEKRKAANLPTEGLELDDLTRKLRANEAMLKAKHKCRMVRFVVASEAGKVTFKPVRID